MNPNKIIDKYYPQDSALRSVLLIHSYAVVHKAMK